jgi:hypothetical protein
MRPNASDRPPVALRRAWAALRARRSEQGRHLSGGPPGRGHRVYPVPPPWGGHWARSRCRFVLPLIHFMPDSLTYSVPLCLKRQCDRTLGGQPHQSAGCSCGGAEAEAAGRGRRPRAGGAAEGLLAFCTSIFWPIGILRMKENERGVVTQVPSYRWRCRRSR